MQVRSALNIADLRRAAKTRLPRSLFDFIDRGNEDDIALRNNVESFQRIKLRPRVLVDVSNRTQTASLFGITQDMPIGIAPTGPAAHLWFDGERALARAASKFMIPFCLSNAAATPMELIAATGDGPKWFQLYMTGDRALTLQTVDRARNAGFDTLVLTLDSLFEANREFVQRSGYRVPLKFKPGLAFDLASHPRWLLGTIGRYMMSGGLPLMVNYPIANPRDPVSSGVKMKDDSISWETLALLRERWPGKLVLKGILDPRDAQLALLNGADGIIVSNHGGVMLDSSISPIDALPSIVDSVRGKLPVFLDGGIRRGSDVVKALALGADMVFVGRATLYGLGAFGEAGAVRALEILQAEVDRTLAALGCQKIASLDRTHCVLSHDAHRFT